MMKPKQFCLRVNKDEHEKIKRRAKRAGISVNHLLRDAINGKHCLCNQHLLRPLINSSKPIVEDWVSEVF